MTIDALKSRARGLSLGLFAADLGALRAAAERSRNWGCDIHHFDIMDGVFVPPMIGGPGFVAATDTGALRDVHLMVQRPQRHVAAFVAAGADIITVHAESDGAPAALEAIRATAAEAERLVLAGLALTPTITLEQATACLAQKPDHILVLSLDPRISGASADTAAACARLNTLRSATAAWSPVLALDGGVTLGNIAEISAARPDLIVSGSAVFRAANPAAAFAKMQAAWQVGGDSTYSSSTT